MHALMAPRVLAIASVMIWVLGGETRAGLRITEVMADAVTMAEGDPGHDWIEIHNAGESTVDLEGYFLTDDSEALQKWSFPQAKLHPGEFLVVWATNDDSSRDARRLRVPFQLKARGESVLLVAPDGVTTLHKITFPRQRPGLSYGMARAGWAGDAEAAAEWGTLRWPTPGAANAGCLDGFVRAIHMSTRHGYFEDPFTLRMETSTEGAVIRYTTDGSQPEPFTGREYMGPIEIDRTTTLRARAFADGLHPSPVVTQTYLFLQDVVRQSPGGEAPPGWPSRRANRQVLDYGMDPDIVNKEHTPDEVVASLRSLPSLSIVTSIENLFDRRIGIYANPRNKGRAWERRASFELLDPEGGATFQLEAGLRVRGAWSRQPDNPKHALRLVFRKAYGSGKLRFPLFGEEGVKEFDHIDLRTSLNYAWVNRASSRNTLLRDIFCRDSQRDMGQPYTRSRYYHLYLNGHYWGVYMTQERAVGPYAASYMGGDPEDYDVVKSRGELTEGTWDAHRAYFYLAVQGFGDDANYFRVQGLNPDGSRNRAFPRYLDVDNVIDYMILTYYSGNQDGPGGRFTNFPNNFYANFNRENPDGWKYYAHDMEHTFDVGSPNIEVRDRGIPWKHFNVHWLHEQLIDNPHYLRRYKERVGKHLFGDGALTVENALARLDARKAEIHEAMIAHSARWGDAGNGRANRPYTRKTWLIAVGRLRDFIANRNERLVEDFIRLGWYRGVKPPELIETRRGLAITAEEGRIYYTLDGSDPKGVNEAPARQAEVAQAATLRRHVLIDQNTRMRAWPATHGRFDRQWRAIGFDDSDWKTGLPGLGYDDDGDYFEARLIRFDVTKTMRGKTNSVYMRVPFELPEVGALAVLDLEMKCDDGFAAFLNGSTMVASSGAPRSLSWRSVSAEKPSDGVATSFQRYRLPLEAPRLLRSGQNVLAIHGLNVGLDSSDLIMIPRLTGTTVSGGTVFPRRARIRARAHFEGEWSPLTTWP